ncbi:hypothetical protein I4F81_011330 [Pyropia yezoensis]|uniref:Uncharacterized protein n=1 Tax=Pyropia yezoensis TaxID=2788 RepID=A0ACC3CG96_PYRYE|nr:hypothetical protein I4F81_011330 [Neopyropia yezoensis]
MFGVVGIPVTALAPAAQTAGIRFISCRNEQAAGYAAAAVGYLTAGRSVGALLSVSGPGLVHALAGIAGAGANGWPLVALSGSCDPALVGRGAFQELDQAAAAAPLAKAVVKVDAIGGLAVAVAGAVATSMEGMPGGVYVDLPTTVLHAKVEVAVGGGAALGGAEAPLRALVDDTRLPFVPTPMAKGTIPDSHPAAAIAARSLALGRADVALVVGARLNWLLHHGAPPKWAPDVTFVHVDVDAASLATSAATAAAAGARHIGLLGDAATVVAQLHAALRGAAAVGGGDGATAAAAAAGGHPTTGLGWGGAPADWADTLAAKAAANGAKMATRLAAPTPPGAPMDFHAALAVLAAAMAAAEASGTAVTLASEGANTMDIGRAVLSHERPRCRLDAGTWGTMGVGLGYALAAAVVRPSGVVVALEGDSAFGFSGMEVETACRYRLPIVVVVFNNGGIYGGTGTSGAGAWAADPPPTSFVPAARYEALATAFGGEGYYVEDPAVLREVLAKALAARVPAVVNVRIDPSAGTESGRMTSHN